MVSNRAIVPAAGPGDWTGAIERIAEELADFQPASR